MKIVSYRRRGTAGYGALIDGRVHRYSYDAEEWPTLGAALRASLDLGEGRVETHPTFAIDEIELSCPVTDPGRILCVGLNYRSHILETGRPTPERPMVFARYADSLVASGQPLVRPRVSAQFDFEGELAVVIGPGGRHIAAQDALAHVAGYACFQDGSIRDYQNHTSQFLPGKTFWRSGSWGPWLVTPDEVPDVAAMHLETRLNGQIMQQAPLSDLLFGVPALVEYLSAIMPLQPGDVIATGTTGGVGARRTPPIWMKPGDTVEVEISGLGVLVNSIVDEADKEAASAAER